MNDVKAILDQIAELEKLPKPTGAKYRQAVIEEAFEKWMYWGAEVGEVLRKQEARAKKDGDFWSAKYWRDVLRAARSCDTSENRAQRDAMRAR